MICVRACVLVCVCVCMWCMPNILSGVQELGSFYNYPFKPTAKAVLGMNNRVQCVQLKLDVQLQSLVLYAKIRIIEIDIFSTESIEQTYLSFLIKYLVFFIQICFSHNIFFSFWVV